MRTVLTVLCAFTITASLWLFTMYLILRHPGFQARAALSVLLAGIGITTLVAVHQTRPAFALRLGVALGSAMITVVGAGAVVDNNRPGDGHYEGYVDLIGLALVTQGLLTLWWAVVGRVRTA